MKLWPPNPGFTDMINTRSTSSRTYSIWDRGVPGFRTTPAMQPRPLIMLTTRWRWIVDAASQCTEMMSAPALAKSSTRCSGSTIMRWQSSSASGSFLRNASTTSGPMVMLGTKRPSMASTWTQSAPAFNTSSTSWPSLEKSAERMEGEICTVFSFISLSFATRGLPSRRATTRALAFSAPAARRRRSAEPAANAAPVMATAAGSKLEVEAGAGVPADPASREAVTAGDVRSRCGWGPATKAAAPPKSAGIMTVR
mmetsp:Transcript_52007/g.161393  ORF Transcript_52007/g.161393 Transcript_52007/m.161393 type:complete len:254 (-) Transcript_52007:67-828(-)